MNDKMYTNNLLDYYGSLLTAKQQEICQLYFCEDYSLFEISEIYKTSRNAIYDIIKRSQKTLYHYEQHLQCYHRSQERQKQYDLLLALNDKRVYEIVKKLIEMDTKEDI